jgi:hypothetical protein
MVKEAAERTPEGGYCGSCPKAALIVFLGWTAGMLRRRQEGINSSQESDMVAVGIFIAIFVALFVAVLLPLIMSGERWRAAEEKACARRIADARMNARLLRLNL